MVSFREASAAASASRSSAGEDAPLDDHELLARTALGDENAFAALSERHLRRMIAVAQRVLGNAAEADEVAQEAFLRLWRYAPNWDPKGTGSVRTWLSRVVTNLCLDTLRRRRSVSLEEEGDIEDPAMGPVEALGREDRRRLVRRLLLKLPERQRLAIVFSYFEEMSGQEIAAALGVSVGAVESLLVRGREGLRRGMREMGIVWGEDV